MHIIENGDEAADSFADGISSSFLAAAIIGDDFTDEDNDVTTTPGLVVGAGSRRDSGIIFLHY
jgi:hypothetical protein